MNQDRQADVHADNDSRQTRYWQEWEVSGRELRSVLCVATAIELRPGSHGFDEGELHRLIAEAQEIMRSGDNPIDLLRIVPEA